MRRLARLATNALVVAAVSITPLITATQAHAAFVGKNGFIAFAGDRHTGKADIWVVNANGAGAKDLTAGNGLQDRSPVVSPEGGPHIAWVASRCRSGCPGDIWVMDSRGGHVFNATRSPDQDEESPSWAPSGGVIAFSRASASGGTADIWSMVWTGTPSSFKRLTRSGANDVQPAYSPIDRLIAFASNRSGSYGIYTMDPGGNNVTLLAADAQSPDWHPRGTSITFVRGGNVWVMRADGSHRRQLTSSGKDSFPGYSPDGQRIVFQRGGAVMVMNVDGTHAHRVTGTGLSAGQPDWRPECNYRGTDGPNRMVGTSASELFCPSKGNDVVIMGGGDDRVYAGAGSDTIYGNGGRDFVEGGMGAYRDVVYGGSGADYLTGNQGNDKLVGGSGADFLEGGPGDDTLLARDGVYGNDWVVGEQKDERSGDACSGDVPGSGKPPKDALVSCEHLLK